MNPEVTLVLLAGGEGRRMGGRDKGLLDFAGRPLVAHVLERLSPQVGSIILSANRNREAYTRFGHPVVADRRAGHLGPLAGIEAALSEARTPWALVVPCDLPFLPPDLERRLARPGGAAVARAAGRRHAVLRLPVSAGADVTRLLDAGERRFGALCDALDAVTVDFDDCPEAFRNLNTPEALRGG